MMNQLVYTVIATYNGQNYIRKCMDSLLQSYYPTQIIVVDNNSSDETLDILRSYKNIVLVESNENLGFGRANNIGISKAILKKADFVFLLNQDAWVEPDTIGNLIEAALSNTDCGIISPVHLNKDGSKLDPNFLLYLSQTRPNDFMSDLFIKKVKPIYHVGFVNAAAWLLSRKTLAKVGGFDPLFFHYGEDADYVNRIHFHNLKIGVVCSSVIFHARDNYVQQINSTWMKIKKGKSLVYRYSLLELKFLKSNLLRIYLTQIRQLLKKAFISTVKGETIQATASILCLWEITKNWIAIKESRSLSRSEKRQFAYLRLDNEA
jgi:GT2 family glycosyltransferase